MCIYDGEQMVGFMMWEEDEEDHELGMCRLMIDQKFQNQGYGRASVIKLMEVVRQKNGHPFMDVHSFYFLSNDLIPCICSLCGSLHCVMPR